MTTKQNDTTRKPTHAHATNDENAMHPKTKTHTHVTTDETSTKPLTTEAAMTTPAQIPAPPPTISTTPSATATSATTTGSGTTTVANAGLAAFVASITASLDAMEKQLGPQAPAVTNAEKRRRAKPRKGSDKVITQLAPVVEQFGLNSTSLNTAQMLAQHQMAETLVPLQARLQKVSKRVDDEVFNAQTGSWEMGLQFYSLLQRRAKSDGEVENAIEPLAKAFAFRSTTVKAAKPTKTVTRIKARLMKTIALAQKHGVSVTVGPNGEPTGISGNPTAVAAAQAAIASGAPVVSAAPSPPASAPAASPSASAAPAVSPTGH